MVSMLVQRQQREAAMRKERLLAARQEAAALSIRQARSYQNQKRVQETCVREDARQQWLESQTRDVAVIDGLLVRISTEQGEAQEAAARCKAHLQAEACKEAAAWRAERQLEAARHRLAVAHTRVEAHERAKLGHETELRRAAVREMEKVRAARAAATAPAPFSLSSVLGSMQAPSVATHAPVASIPVPQPSREPLRTAAPSKAGAAPDDAPLATQSAPRRWRMSQVAPHVHVTLHGATTHRAATSEKTDIGDVTAADEAVPASADAYAKECAAIQQRKSKLLKDGQERAAQRAASVLCRQRAMELQQQEEDYAQKERLAAVKTHYRHPFEEKPTTDSGEGAAAKGDACTATAVGTTTTTTTTTSDHPPKPQNPSHRPTRHQQAYLKGEKEFRAAFVEAPPVMVRLDEQPPRRAPLSELLRPVKMTDLLYSLAHRLPADAVTLTPTQKDEFGASPAVSRHSSMTGGAPKAVQPSARARVLPSVPLRTLPLDHRTSVSPETTEPAPAGKTAVDAPLSNSEEACVSPPPPRRDSNDPLRAPLHASAEALTAPSTMQLDVQVDYTSPPRTPSPKKDVAAEEVVAISPLTPVPLSCAEVPLADLGDEPTGRSAPDAIVTHQKQPLAALGGRWTPSGHPSTSTSLSESSSRKERTPGHHRHNRSFTPSTPLSTSIAATSEATDLASGSSSASSEESSGTSGIDASSSSKDSSSIGGSSCYSMPVMTAEQLKLALLRLRSRIRSAQK
ncbi:hypothetical protein JKF63_07346 [Porcisia hertigi]|uniref:Uncharacterized protein n=1 Tax=Porcisia hertigi TaxID=2761500 RepID=A0A837AXQ2_9TRYP|nr:hypothetical protein JKF63_07346 [Porcisia hertigi]